MNTWPASITYLKQNYQVEVAPDVSRSPTVTGKHRQRLQRVNRNDAFRVQAVVDATQKDTFEAFYADNPGAFTGPYFDNDVEQTGTLRFITNSYEARPMSQTHWLIAWSFEVIDRQHEIGQQLYDFALATGETFFNLHSVAAALEKAVNENEL